MTTLIALSYFAGFVGFIAAAAAVYGRKARNTEETVVTVRYPSAGDTYSAKAYTLDVQPYESVTYSDGYVVQKYTPSRGYRTVIEPAARFSAKRLDALTSDPRVTSMVQTLVDRVIADKRRGA